MASSEGARQKPTAVRWGAADRGSAAVERQRRLRALQRQAAVCWESGQWWHKRQRKLRARKGHAAAAALTDRARLGEAQGRNAGHWRGLTAGVAQRKCERCGMKMSGGAPFYKTVWQLKGF